MISVCLPSRGRPARFLQAIRSAHGTARGEIEVIAWVDDDDPAFAEYMKADAPWLRIIHGPREIQSNLWNRCWAEARGDLAMLAADDILFKTPGWDLMVARAFEEWPDRIACVYGDDGSRWKEATLPFVSREWIEAAGTFTPPYFKSWFADRWIWDIAAFLERKRFLPRLRIEHRHASYGKAPKDALYLEAERFREEQRPKELFFSAPMVAERCEQMVRLAQAIEAAKRRAPAVPV